MDPYAQIAAFYEAEYGPATADVAFYARNGGGGPLLVLGCGTGRISRQLASTRRVLGLDRSESMLAEARRRSPDGAFVQGDMRDFSLGTFSEIIVPNGAFNFLETRDDQQRCLTCCRAALEPGGTLTLDLPMPQFHLWGQRHQPPVLSWQGELDGRPARRTRETFRSVVRQRLDLVDRYYLDETLVARSTLGLRIVMPAEVEWMMEATGFYVDELLGDFSGGRLGEESPRLIVRAALL